MNQSKRVYEVITITEIINLYTNIYNKYICSVSSVAPNLDHNGIVILYKL